MKKRNRAKCRVCKQVIESMSAHDMQVCSCGEISIDGGTEYYKASFHDPYNFLRIDEDGTEIEITFNENPPSLEKEKPVNDPTSLTKEDMLDMLKLHIESYENLPDNAKHAPVTVYDLQCLAMLVHSILKAS